MIDVQSPLEQKKSYGMSNIRQLAYIKQGSLSQVFNIPQLLLKWA